MSIRMNIVAGVAALVAATAIPGNAVEPKQVTPKSQDKQVLADEQIKQLLPLIDGPKISKQEWMKFMEAEFERLDKHKTGVLDVKEISPSRSRTVHPADLGK